METEPKILYQVQELPVLQNRLFDSFDEAVNCSTGNVTLKQNKQTGVVYNEDFSQDLIKYDEKYNNEQSLSSVFKEHLADVCKVIERRLGRSQLIEVGCGKGYFLEMLQTKGFDIVGYDPAYEGDNTSIEKRMFDPKIKSVSHGIILRHVLEHIHEPWIFIEKIKSANNGKGLIYIEVPCFDWILNNNAWFDVFYEHVNYFRSSDFENYFSELIDVGWLFGGQYLYIVADLAKFRGASFIPNKIKIIEKCLVRNIPLAQNKTNRKKVVWGASSKGVIYTLVLERNGINIDAVVDIDPNKQNKYLPVSGKKVISDVECFQRLGHSTDLYVMNSNYMMEIQRATKFKYNYFNVEND